MSVYTFGLNASGALSLGDLLDYNKPQKVNYFSTINKRVKKIAAGSYNTVFVTDDDELYIAGLDKDPKYGTTLFLGIDQGNNSPSSIKSNKDEESKTTTTTGGSNGSTPVNISPNSISPITSSPRTSSDLTSSPKIPHNISTRNLLNKDKPALPNRPEVQKSQIKLEKLSTPPTTPPLVSVNNTTTNTTTSGPNNTLPNRDQDLSKSTYQIQRQMEFEPPKTLPIKISTTFLEKMSPGNIIKQVALGNYHIILLTEVGNVWSWGCNFNGQCGYPQESAQVPRMVELKCVKYIAAGVKHTAAINEWGELYVWGLNEHGELGLGDTNDRRSPTRVKKLKSEMVSIVACSSTTSCCYTESGKMFLWGQCDEKGKNQMIPLQLPIHTYLSAESENGVCGGGGRVKQIGCGQWQVAALTQMGEVFLWNVGSKPVPLRGILENNSIRSIAMGNFHLICLTDSGEVITLGRNKTGQLGREADGNGALLPGIVKELSYDSTSGLNKDEFVVSIAAGEYHSVALVENTPKTKHALLLLRMQRNYLRQLNILEKIYYRSILAISTPLDSLGTIAGGRESLTLILNGNSGGGNNSSSGSDNRSSLTTSNNSNSPSPTPISSSSSSSSGGLISGNNTISKSRSTSMATIKGIFGIPNTMAHLQDLDFNTMVSEEEVKEIFSDIETLVKSTETFLSRLDARLDNWDPDKKLLDDIFLDESILSSYRVYIPFSDNYNHACMMVFNIKKRSEKFANVLKEAERKSKLFGIRLDQEFVKEIDLKSLLLAPLQNIPRIYIMLKELSLSTLPNTLKDFNSVNAAAGKFQVLLERMNQNFQFVDAVEILNCSSNEYGEPQIMGGSLNQLVDKLTHHNISDPNFRDVFLLTFRSFTKPDKLLQLLSENFGKQGMKTGNNRVINILTSWVVQHFYDFESDALLKIQDPNHDPIALSQQLEAFINNNDPNAKRTDIPITQMTPISQIWTQYCKQRELSAPWRTLAPSQILPTTSNQIPVNFNLLDYSPLEVAQTITNLDHVYLSRIDKRELLQLRWTKSKSPNIQASTDHFNRMSQIVLNEILKSKSSKGRASIIAFFLQVANCCFELNNFSGVASIIYGLNNATVSRLKKTWSKLTKDHLNTFEYLDKIVTPMKNYISLRHLMTTVQPPCVPFLGTFLKDLTFIEEGNPSIIGGLINFYKQRKIAEVIFQIQQFQQVSYNSIHPNSTIRDYIVTTQLLDEKQCQKLSTEYE